jgi:hypothetical protein
MYEEIQIRVGNSNENGANSFTLQHFYPNSSLLRKLCSINRNAKLCTKTSSSPSSPSSSSSSSSSSSAAAVRIVSLNFVAMNP